MDTDKATQFVLREISRYRRYDDIALELCQQYGLKWDEAMAFVHQVEGANYDKLSSRHRRTLVGLGLLTALVGFVLSVGMLLLPLTGLRFDLVVGRLIDIPFGGNVAIFLLGIAMFAGGAVGTYRAARNR